MTREYFFSFDKYTYIRGSKPAGCILCLIRDQSPDVVDLSVYRDELFIVAVNLYPYNPGHLLIFPSRHIRDIRELSRQEESKLCDLIRYFLEVTDAILSPSGYNIGYNMGPSAGASIEHLHLHIIPRFPHELGIADLIAGKRVLVEEPRETARRIRERMVQEPFSRESS